jgi:hypothetical protein
MKITSLNEFRENIIDVIGSVTSQMLENTEDVTEYRLDVLSGTDGARVGICYVYSCTKLPNKTNSFLLSCVIFFLEIFVTQ